MPYKPMKETIETKCIGCGGVATGGELCRFCKIKPKINSHVTLINKDELTEPKINEIKSINQIETVKTSESLRSVKRLLKNKFFCLHCGTIGKPIIISSTSETWGPFFLIVGLLGLYFLPLLGILALVTWFFYYIHVGENSMNVCPACENSTIIPAYSPRALEHLGDKIHNLKDHNILYKHRIKATDFLNVKAIILLFIIGVLAYIALIRFY